MKMVVVILSVALFVVLCLLLDKFLVHILFFGTSTLKLWYVKLLSLSLSLFLSLCLPLSLSLSLSLQIFLAFLQAFNNPLWFLEASCFSSYTCIRITRINCWNINNKLRITSDLDLNDLEFSFIATA